MGASRTASVRQVQSFPQVCDIAIVGGGPAGSTAALLLARQGYHVVLFDRDPVPRAKPCGEYLTPGAVALLRDTLGVLPQMMAQGAAPIVRETIYAHDGRAFGGPADALACPRTVTDTVLREAARDAGATVIEGVSVREVLREGGRIAGVRVRDADGMEWQCRARMTIGADGTRSLVARTMGVVRPLPRLQNIALVGHFSYPANTADRPGAVTMHLPTDGTHACCGVGTACGPDGTRNVNIVVPLSEGPRMAGRREAYFAERLQQSFPRVWDEWRRAVPTDKLLSVPCFGHHTARATARGALLVGDAATFIHPFTGEGVFFALRGAELAALAIDAALRAGNCDDPLHEYDRARARDLLPRYRLCDWVQRAVHLPRLLPAAGRVLRRTPALTRRLLRAVGDLDRPLPLPALPKFHAPARATLCTPRTLS